MKINDQQVEPSIRSFLFLNWLLFERFEELENIYKPSNIYKSPLVRGFSNFWKFHCASLYILKLSGWVQPCKTTIEPGLRRDAAKIDGRCTWVCAYFILSKLSMTACNKVVHLILLFQFYHKLYRKWDEWNQPGEVYFSFDFSFLFHLFSYNLLVTQSKKINNVYWF